MKAVKLNSATNDYIGQAQSMATISMNPYLTVNNHDKYRIS